MNPLELAMKMEQDGENFYLKLADKTTNPGLREIFNQLAADETKHYQLFQSMRQPQWFTETTVLKDAANMFRQLVAGEKLNSLDVSQLELYQKAMDLEEESRRFYLDAAAGTADPAHRELFQKIAVEEEKHYYLLHNIYELVLRPETWIENGEFVHLEEY